jgi:hypothetical protein
MPRLKNWFLEKKVLVVVPSRERKEIEAGKFCQTCTSEISDCIAPSYGACSTDCSAIS